MMSNVKKPFKPPVFSTPLKAPAKAQTASKGADVSASKQDTPSHSAPSSSGKNLGISPLISRKSRENPASRSLNIYTQQAPPTTGKKKSQSRGRISNTSLPIIKESHSAPSSTSNDSPSSDKRAKGGNKEFRKSSVERESVPVSNFHEEISSKHPSSAPTLSRSELAHSNNSNSFDGSLPLNLDSQNASLPSSRSSSRSVTPARELTDSIPWGIHVTPQRDTVIKEYREKLSTVLESSKSSVSTDQSDVIELEVLKSGHSVATDPRFSCYPVPTVITNHNELSANFSAAVNYSLGNISSYEHTLQHVHNSEAIIPVETSNRYSSQEITIDDNDDIVEFVDLTDQSNPCAFPIKRPPLDQFREKHVSDVMSAVDADLLDSTFILPVNNRENTKDQTPLEDSAIKRSTIEQNQLTSVTKDPPSIIRKDQEFSGDVFDSQASLPRVDQQISHNIYEKNEEKSNYSACTSKKQTDSNKNNLETVECVDLPPLQNVTVAPKEPVEKVIKAVKNMKSAVKVDGKINSKSITKKPVSSSPKTSIEPLKNGIGTAKNMKSAVKVDGEISLKSVMKKSISSAPKTLIDTESSSKSAQRCTENENKKISFKSPGSSVTPKKGRPKKIGNTDGLQYPVGSGHEKPVQNPSVTKEKSALKRKNSSSSKEKEETSSVNLRRTNRKSVSVMSSRSSSSQNVSKKSKLDSNIVSPQTIESAVKKARDSGLVPKYVDKRKLKQVERLRVLHKLRDVGVWVQCCNRECSKWRYLDEYKDPVNVPHLWYCKMNKDLKYNACSIPEQVKTPEEEADLIENSFTAGSIVWARVSGFPFWPAMVEDDPEVEQFYWLNDYNDTEVTHYHVTFFDSKNVTRAWVPPAAVQPFHESENDRYLYIKKVVGKQKVYLPRILFAQKMALEAVKLDNAQRLDRFSFINRYAGPIAKTQGLSEDSQDSQNSQVSQNSQNAQVSNDDLLLDPKSQHSDQERVFKEPPQKQKKETTARVFASSKQDSTVECKVVLDKIEIDHNTGLFTKTGYNQGSQIDQKIELGPLQFDSTLSIPSNIWSGDFNEFVPKESGTELLDNESDLKESEVSSSQDVGKLDEPYDGGRLVVSPVMDSMEDLTADDVKSMSQEANSRNSGGILTPVSAGLQRLSQTFFGL